jgi:hypothetical protein
MKVLLLVISSILLHICIATKSLAVEPTAIEVRHNERNCPPLSKVIDDPFDGKIVYDIDTIGYSDITQFISSWSRKEIRVTYYDFQGHVVGYRPALKYYQYERPPRYAWVNESIRKDLVVSPKELQFSIGGKIHTYTNGKVPEELAKALANAPSGDMFLRAVWSNNTYSTMRIGPQTVAAWKEIFRI